MILAIEGPDKSGKTTLWNALKGRLPGNPWFVGQLPPADGFWPEAELRQEALWSYLHDPAKLYVCDRFFAVSSPVYDRLFKRRTLIAPELWRPRVLVAYVDVPLAELWRRHSAEPDEYISLQQLLTLTRFYKEAVFKFRWFRVVGSVEEGVDRVKRAVARWGPGAARGGAPR